MGLQLRIGAQSSVRPSPPSDPHRTEESGTAELPGDEAVVRFRVRLVEELLRTSVQGARGESSFTTGGHRSQEQHRRPDYEAVVLWGC